MTIMFVESFLTFKRHLKAFDNILLEQFEHYCIHGLAIDWLRSFLKNHKQYLSLHGVSSSIKTII